ncbi:MAG: serine hydrolase domain-containing protein [Kordiimonas sp.]
MGLLKKGWFWVALPLSVIAVTLMVSDTARRFGIYGPTMVAAAGAKLACSGVYVSGRAPDHVIEHDLANFYGPFFGYADYEFDTENRTATATVLGLISRSALYRPGLGCTLMVDVTVDELMAQAQAINEPAKLQRPELWPAGDMVDLGVGRESIDFAALNKAVDGAFDTDEAGLDVDTRAVIVVHDGKIIAERYADGYTEQTRFLGWSASKAVTSALIGTMVMDGKLSVNRSAPIVEWEDTSDPRSDISLHHLLTMTSGLEFSEPYIPDNDSTDMLFKLPRMGDFVASKPLVYEPGTHWYYSSGTTNLLSRIYFEQAGGTIESNYETAQQRFFEPLGMTSAVFETDVSGAFVGSSYFYATARDWARFGLLYLNDGMVGDKQVLTKEWVDYSRAPIAQAKQGQYGAQFWLNAGEPDNPADNRYPDLPRDYYMASGYNDQHIGIIPSKNAVVVRFGWTVGEAKFDLNGHYARILAALPDAKPPEVPAYP